MPRRKRILAVDTIRPTPPPMAWRDFIGITRALVTWYRFMTDEQRKQLPGQVLNAFDSLDQLHGRRRANNE